VGNFIDNLKVQKKQHKSELERILNIEY